MLILLCFFRAVVVAFLLTHGKPHKEKYVVMALMINWLCISLLTAILVTMFAPVVLTFGMISVVNEVVGVFFNTGLFDWVFVFSIYD